jgi:hypothetical protein
MAVMKNLSLFAAIVFALLGCGTKAKVVPAPNQTVVKASPETSQICFLRGGLPSSVKYTVIGQVKGSKKTYGHTEEVLVIMAWQAKKAGGDAVIDLDAGQRFGGVLPWDVVRPKGNGTVVKFDPGQKKFDCEENGGKLF